MALTGSDQDVVNYLTTRRTQAAHQDDRYQVQTLAQESALASVRTAAEEALKGSDDQVSAFLATGQYEAGAQDFVAIAQIIDAGGPVVHRPQGRAGLRQPAKFRQFITTGQYQARTQDERVRAAQLIDSGGPDLKSAARIALEGPDDLLDQFIQVGQYKAQRQDFLGATHTAQIAQLIADAAGIAATAQQRSQRPQGRRHRRQGSTAGRRLGEEGRHRRTGQGLRRPGRQVRQGRAGLRRPGSRLRPHRGQGRRLRRQVRERRGHLRRRRRRLRPVGPGIRHRRLHRRRPSPRLRHRRRQGLQSRRPGLQGRLPSGRGEEGSRTQGRQRAPEARPKHATAAACSAVSPANTRPAGASTTRSSASSPPWAPPPMPRAGRRGPSRRTSWALDNSTPARAGPRRPASNSPRTSPSVQVQAPRTRYLDALQDLRLKRYVPGCAQCFPAGTKVLMADSGTRRIETIHPGDTVLATDPATGRTAARKVSRLIITDGDKHFDELTITTPDGPRKLTATYEHPFWNPSAHQWVEARDLTPGTTLLSTHRTTVRVKANRAFDQHTRTYNLTVDDLHTYYVLAGETRGLVHNSTTPCPTVARIAPGSLPQRKRLLLVAL